MSIDKPLFSFANNDQIMDKLKNFEVDGFDLSKHKTVFPTLIHTISILNQDNYVNLQKNEF